MTAASSFVSKLDSAEITYQVMGDGPPLVLLHPFPASRDFWLPAARLLSHKYRVVVPDLRGHGDSTPGDGAATMQKHASDVAQLCDIREMRSAAFAGVSIGGYILMEFWRRYPERVAALALCDTKGPADTAEARAGREKAMAEIEARGPGEFIESMIAKLLGESTRRSRPDVMEAARRMMQKASVAGLVANLKGLAERPDSMATLKTITVPTLLLVGAEDTTTPVSDTEAMRQQIRNSMIEIIPRAGHYAAFEQHETATVILRRFLDAQKLGA